MPKSQTRKIIFIHLLNDFSGSPKVLSQVIKVAQSSGIEIELYTGNKSIGFLSNLTENHHFVGYKRFENKYLTLFSFVFSQVILFFKLLKYWRKDVDIYANTMLPFGAGIAGWIMKKRVIYHIHETYIKPKILKIALRKIIQLTTTELIFVSKSLKSLEGFKGIKENIIYNSLPIKFQEEGKVHVYKSTKVEKFNVLMISSMKAYKGIFELIEIARKTENNPNIDFTLVLNASQVELKHFFKTTKLPSNLVLEHQQSDVIPFYKKASLVLNLSHVDDCIETFGLTILEALSFGVPVIVPPVGGPSEIVNEGKEGFLISSYDTNKIAKKIIELSTDTQACMELSQNAKERALDFSENKFNKEISNVITPK